jgi:hypothetical protein
MEAERGDCAGLKIEDYGVSTGPLVIPKTTEEMVARATDHSDRDHRGFGGAWWKFGIGTFYIYTFLI